MGVATFATGFFGTTAGEREGLDAGRLLGAAARFAGLLAFFFTTAILPLATFLAGDFLAVLRLADLEDALRVDVFFTAFFTAFLFAAFLPPVFLTAALLAVLRVTFFVAFLLAGAFFTAFLLADADLCAAFFLVELARLDALRAADFFAADLRVVAMRAYSSGYQWCDIRIIMMYTQ